MSSVQVQFTGTGQFPLDIKISEDLTLRNTLISGAPATTLQDGAGTDIPITRLNGNAQWEAIRARSDMTITLTGADQTTVTFLVDMADLLQGAPDDVVIIQSLDADYRILRAEVTVTTGVACSTVTLRDAAGGSGNALSSALDGDGSPARDADDGALGVPTALKGTGLFARRSDDGIIGTIFVEAVRVN